MKKQSLIKGSLVLGAAGIIAKFLGLFFRWPLIILIGDEGIGYYQLSYPLYMFYVAMASGVPVAISNYSKCMSLFYTMFKPIHLFLKKIRHLCPNDPITQPFTEKT